MRQLYAPGYRHELKYYINQGDYTLLSNLLRTTTMSMDENADEYGEYFIRSLYFDDLDDNAFRDKLDGLEVRDKIRLRYYNLDPSLVKLECKHKQDSYVKKESVDLTQEECEQLLRGRYTCLLHKDSKFARSMYARFATGYYLPRVVVDYTREAYVFPLEDVRVTFDKGLRTGLRRVDLFNPDLITYPALEGQDMVMEVKYNRYLPTDIRSLIQAAHLQRNAISKYCICRKFEL